MSKSTASILVDTAIEAGAGFDSLTGAIFQNGYNDESFAALDAFSRSIKLYGWEGTPGKHVDGDIARSLVRVDLFGKTADYAARVAACKRAIKKVYA